MGKFRVGIIGTGRIADMHYLGYKGNPKAEVYALCDADQTILQGRASEWGVEKTYQDYRRLLEDPAVDAVEVITPHHLHAEMAIAALEAGKHVSVQKPMALNIAEADAMIRAANRSGKLLRVIENYRYYQPFTKAKEIIDAGDIGEPLSIRIKSVSGTAPDGWEVPDRSHEWRSDPSRSGEGSVLFDHGYHIWSIAMYFLGEVERVFSYIGRTKVVSHYEVQPGSFLDSPAMVTWKYAGSDTYGACEAVHSEGLMVQSRYYPVDVGLEITGSRGVLLVNHGPNGRMFEKPAVEVYRDGVTKSFSDLDTDYADSFARAVGDFLDAIQGGRESDLTGPDAREVLRFSLAILLSGRERREVRVDEVT